MALIRHPTSRFKVEILITFPDPDSANAAKEDLWVICNTLTCERRLRVESELLKHARLYSVNNQVSASLRLNIVKAHYVQQSDCCVSLFYNYLWNPVSSVRF